MTGRGRSPSRGEASAFAIARFTLAATWRRRWPGYVATVVLVGALGGLAMGAVAGARRTQSSYNVYLASTDPPQLFGVSGIVNPAFGSTVAYNPALVARIAHLPHVTGQVTLSGLNVVPLNHGRPNSVPTLPPEAGEGLGLDNASPISIFSVVAGRRADPRRADEVMVQKQVARFAHIHLGQRLTFGVYTNAQTGEAGFGTARVRPVASVTVTVVGLYELSSEVIEDDVDFVDQVALFTPAFTHRYVNCCANYSQTGLRLTSPSEATRVIGEIAAILPRGVPAYATTSVAQAKADLALRPLSIALGGFGAIVAVAALVIGSQLVARGLRRGEAERRALWALGAGPRVVAVTGLLGVVASVAAGAALAVGVAIALSPIAPLGPVRPYFPHRGVALDPLVLCVGAAALIVALGLVALVLEVRMAPLRAARRAARRGPARSRVTGAATARLPVPASVGVRFAVDPGSSQTRVPARSVMAAGILSVLVLVTTITFGASLDSLVAHPRLYGWNWDYLLSAGTGSGNAPAGLTRQLLGADPYVASWAGQWVATVPVDGSPVPALGERPGASVQPPLISGHGLESSDQVVLAPGTLAALHRRVGQTVSVAGSGPARRLTIVGVATFPAMGGSGGPHLEMGTGALVDQALLPAAAKNPFQDPVPGPQGILVRMRPGSGAAGVASLNAIARRLSNPSNFGVFVVKVLHPAEIVDYRSAGTTPAVLGGALGVGVVGAMLLTLLASTRARRRDLALLKVLGLRRRDLSTAVVVQASVTAVVSLVVGIPLGIVTGRTLWGVFAREIYAVPSPTVPVTLVALVALGTFAVTNLAAVLPGRRAAATPVAAVLRTE